MNKGNLRRVLVVDDDILIQQLLMEELREDGYDVTTAANGKDALSILMNERQRPDLVILDLRIPRMSGLDTLSHMVKLNVKLPVIIYTAHRNYKNDPLAKAAKAYIVKSSDISELKKMVHDLI